MKKRKIKRIIFFIVLIMIVLYKIPQKINKQMTVSTLDGATIDIVFNVSWHRYFFSPTETKN